MAKRILFVCVENSNRSQMAEAFARLLGRGAVDAHSAGSRPSGQINPRAVAAMAELGYDLAPHRSKSLKDLPPGPWDAVVTMGCGDSCPQLSARLREDWAISDPREMGPEEFRKVRDQVRDQVAALLARV